MRGAIVLGFCATFLGVTAAFVILTLAGKDTTALVFFATGAATSILPQMLNFLNTHDVKTGLQSVKEDVAEVKQRTNGPLTDMQNQVSSIAAHIDKEGKT